ncbi:hypothetical protein Fmac_022084 [Flemingia macrophylla]|uniref:RBR-type E3 ubiquitin transferase n=1 Tax=Flemingia macrophylla TaxID=520843 RepID=A0ABD1LYQ1_9FABA
MDLTEDWHRLLTEQSREIDAAEAMDADLDFAFRLQLQEALAASLADHPSSSSSSAAAIHDPLLFDDDDDDDDDGASLSETREDLCRLIHDHKVAAKISAIPEKDLQQLGDNFENPFSDGSSSSSRRRREDDVVRVYFKGLVSEEIVRGEKVLLAGIGVAICDVDGNLIFEVSKSLVGNGANKVAAEINALIEAFNAAIALDLRRVDYCCDYYPLFQFCKYGNVGPLVIEWRHLRTNRRKFTDEYTVVSGKWPAKQRKIAMLVDQVNLLRRKFTYCNPRFVARHDVKFAFKLARDAIVSQSTMPVESGSRRSPSETCVICLEDADVSQIFSVDGCQHRYCFSCMKQHVEVKLLHGMLPKCPHEGCKYELLVDSCQKFLTQKLTKTMQQRVLEASIPVAERVYCPHPRCSALMSKTEVMEYSRNLIGQSEQIGPMKCLKCHGLFCFNCKVPWHSGMSCFTYKRLNPNPPAEDLKLKFLASRSLWRQCLKCNHMIELAEGCYHMTCRCGYEFCYNCGAEWKDKKATCACPLWAEDNIWLEDHASDLEEEDDDGDVYDSDHSDGYY